MKSKLEKIIYKMGVLGLIECVLDTSLLSKDYGFTGKNIEKNIKSSDELIVLKTDFSYSDSYVFNINKYEVRTDVFIKEYHYLHFELRFNENKEKNKVSLYDYLNIKKKIDDSNYGLISEVIFNTPWKCTYKKWMNVEMPKWFIEEIDVMYQEQIGRIKNPFKKNRLEQYIKNRNVKYVEVTDKQKKVLYLLGNVLSDLYQEETGQSEVLNGRDQIKCLELLKNAILPMIGDSRDEEELESIIKEAAKKVNQNIKLRGKTLSLEDKNGEN